MMSTTTTQNIVNTNTTTSPRSNPVVADLVEKALTELQSQPQPKPATNFWQDRLKKAQQTLIESTEKLQEAFPEAHLTVEVTIKTGNTVVGKFEQSPAPISEPVKRKPQGRPQTKPTQLKHNKFALLQSTDDSQSDAETEATPAQPKVPTAEPVKPFKPLNGFTEVKKPEPKKTPVKTQPVVKTQPQAPIKRKPQHRPRELTDEEKQARTRRFNALEKARDQMIEECLYTLPENQVESVNSHLQYVIGYRRTLVLDISDDAIATTVDGETFQFSRIRFLEDRTFQFKVREAFAEYLPEAWISFFSGRKPGTFCLALARRRI